MNSKEKHKEKREKQKEDFPSRNNDLNLPINHTHEEMRIQNDLTASPNSRAGLVQNSKRKWNKKKKKIKKNQMVKASQFRENIKQLNYFYN